MGQVVCETLNYECHYNEWKWFFVLEDKFSNAIFVMLWLRVFFHSIGQLFFGDHYLNFQHIFKILDN